MKKWCSVSPEYSIIFFGFKLIQSSNQPFQEPEFECKKVLTGIRVAHRRNRADSIEQETYLFGHIKLDFKKMKAFRDGQEIPLSSKEFDIMKYLIRHEGEAVHRHDLLNEVWGYQAMPTTRTIDNFILDLRKKFERDPAHPEHFVSVRGIGYRFDSLG